MSPWRKQAPDNLLLPALQSWFTTPVGKQLLSEERKLVAESLASSFGHSLLELSIGPALELKQPEGIRRYYTMGAAAQWQLGKSLDAVSDFVELPVASDSQDAVVLHHLLEFVANPHNMLREVERILVPHGRLVIAGFNPFSLLGLKLFLNGRLSSTSIWQHHLLTRYRIVDWLHLLGFELNHCWYGFHRVPLNRPAWFTRPGGQRSAIIRKLPMGGTFVLSATKYRAPITPVRLRWRADPLVNVRPIGAARQGWTRNQLHDS